MNSAIQHALSLWEKSEGKILAGGLSLRSVLELAGSSPVFVYDRKILVNRVRQLRDHLGPDVQLLYSLKANPNPAIVAELAKHVNGFDVASRLELILARSMGHRDHIYQLSGPGKTDEEMMAGVAVGAVLNIESKNQLERLSRLIKDRPTLQSTPVKVALRVNPSFLPGGGGMRMAGRATQFGVEDTEVASIVAQARTFGIEPYAFHFYWGTQTLDGALIARIQNLLWEKAREWINTLSLNIGYINLGGGFGIPYHGGDEPLQLEPIGDALRVIQQELRSINPQSSLVIELGRYLVGEAGLYVTKVIDVKTIGGEIFAITDGGMHHHLAASGNLGQKIHRNFPLVLAEKVDQPATQKANVVGCLCTPMDMLNRQQDLPDVEVEDLVAILQSGAYGASASPSGFLSHAPAKEILL